MTVHDKTKNTPLITVMFVTLVYRKRRHVSKQVLTLILFNKALKFKGRD